MQTYRNIIDYIPLHLCTHPPTPDPGNNHFDLCFYEPVFVLFIIWVHM